MAAAYDTYDYPSYWIGREYEHKSEVLAIREFLSRIHKVKTILEIGAGFGRLIPSYSFRAKKIIVSDPSSKLLKIAREGFSHKKNFRFIHSSLENLPTKLRASSVDLVVLVRVLHHIEDLSSAFSMINRTLTDRGYFILEFPNKTNLKSIVRQIFKGNFTFPLDIFPIDLRSKSSVKRNDLPFFNYHPDKIKSLLEENGFDVIEVRSVSNMRSGPLKKILATDTLLYLEGLLQQVFSFIYFGPSIFILARKKSV